MLRAPALTWRDTAVSRGTCQQSCHFSHDSKSAASAAVRAVDAACGTARMPDGAAGIVRSGR
jgi:hypothetical protein